MDLVILCFLSWLWTPGAAPPRGLGRTEDLKTETQVRPLPSPARDGAEGRARPDTPFSARHLQVNISRAAWRKGSWPSRADDQHGWDFTLILIAFCVAALAFIIYCCFHRKCHTWLLSCLHQSWQGHRRCLPRTTFLHSPQRHGAFAPRTPQSFPVAGSSCKVRFVPSALRREASVHFRRPSVPRDGPASLSAAAPGSGAGCGPTWETVLEMEDEL